MLVSSDCVVGADWLTELFEVARSTERTACAAPLTNGHGACSVPVMGSDAFSSEIAEATVREACAGLPRWTTLPNVNGACIYLRGDIVDAVGLLDAKLTSLEEAIKDWVWRASLLGFTASRANHVYVHRSRLRGDTRIEPRPARRKLVRQVASATEISSTSSNGSRNRSMAAWPRTPCGCNRPAGYEWLTISGTCRASRSGHEPMRSVWVSI